MMKNSSILFGLLLCLWIVTSIPLVHSATCSETTCISLQSCCDDFKNGSICYYSSQQTCTQNEIGQTKLCPFGYQSCGNECYNPFHECCSNHTLHSLTSSQCAAFNCEGKCTSSQHCCNGTCYSPTEFSCFLSPSSNTLQLCPNGDQLCGNTCFNPNVNACNYNGNYYLEPFNTSCQENSCTGAAKPYCCPISPNTTACYSPATQTCAQNVYFFQDFSVSKLCPINNYGIANAVCGPIYVEMGNDVPTQSCYDPTLQRCCVGCSPGGCAASLCNLGDVSCQCGRLV